MSLPNAPERVTPDEWSWEDPDPYRPEWLLDVDEFEALTDAQQKRYLSLINRASKEWVLSPKQREFDAMADRCHRTLVGGSAGPGKSNWLLHRIQRLSRQHPGHATLALRRTHPRLYRTLVRKSIEEFARIPEADRPIWRAGVKEWRFPNGSLIEFGHCETDEDVGQYLSAEYDCIAFDEQTEFTQHQYDMIGSRARTTAVKRRRGVRPHTIGATNPGQVGHEWNRETFVLPTDYGNLGYYEETFTDERTGLNYERRTGYVHATVLDNPHADPEYVGWLLGLPEVERRRYLYGDWDVFEGLYFDEWDRDLHVVHSSTDPINPAWPRRMAVDYGSYAPFCALWGAWDQDGTLHIYRELYKAGTIPDEQARMILDAETDWEATAARGRPVREKVDMHLGDPSMWDQSHRTAGVGMTIYDQYVAGGVPLIKAKNARLAGWARVKQYLRRDSSGRAGVVIHGDACPNLVRTMPLQRRDEKRPEDVDTEGEDHAPDAFRYLCMSQERKWNEPTPEPVREPGKVYDRPGPRRGKSGWQLAQ